jgi:hypothetical protein
MLNIIAEIGGLGEDLFAGTFAPLALSKQLRTHSSQMRT